MNIYPSLDQVLELSKSYNLIPIYMEILADLETPVSAFIKINQGQYSFLLESVVGGERIARYSFLGIDPYLIFWAKKNQCCLLKNGNLETFESSDPIESLKTLLIQYKPYEPEELPSFYGGTVGYFSYDSVRYIETIPDNNKDDLDIPYLHFMFTDNIIIFDHVEHKMKLVCNLHFKTEDNTKEAVEKIYYKGVEQLKKIKNCLQGPLLLEDYEEDQKEIEIRANLTEQEYYKAVEKAKQYIRAGDIFQVQISRRLEASVEGINSFNIYRALRAINPSPYMFYLKFDDLEIVGSSPELLVKKEKKRVVVRPLAGTRRRGRNLEDEIRMEKELKNDIKEQAEHIMLVDLGRNDLGRVCKYGSVKISEAGGQQNLMYCEKYSHVMHLVSEVEGTLLDGKDVFDAFRACFPAGTLTGAPKIRSMEIIEELEPVKRGIYGGGVVYFSFNGDMDSCIAIRTMVIKNKMAYIQTAGGVVYDSKPELEFLETQNKAKALLEALKKAKKI